MKARRMSAVALAIALLAAASLGLGAANGAKSAGESVYQAILQSEVDDSEGAPRAGGDPAAQPQTSLAAAARSKEGPGTLGVEPARAVEGEDLRHAASEVIADPERSGVLSGGCVLGYGTPGEQCVPARAPGNVAMTCAYLSEQFPDGIRVTGKDVLGLDANGDGLACGRNEEAGVHATHQQASQKPRPKKAKRKSRKGRKKG